MMAGGSSNNRKGIASLALLFTWEVWSERKARVFRNKSATPFVLIEKIRKEAALWVLVGAKRLGEIMPGE
jgi:hypothetical protein